MESEWHREMRGKNVGLCGWSDGSRSPCGWEDRDLRAAFCVVSRCTATEIVLCREISLMCVCACVNLKSEKAEGRLQCSGKVMELAEALA